MSTLSKPNVVTMPNAVGRFSLHFVEMCVVMCMGGGLLDALIFGAIGAAGSASFVAQQPLLAAAIVVIDWAIAMAVYMVVRGHPVRHNVEMSGSTVLGAIPFLGLLLAGWSPLASATTWRELFAVMCGPLCALMFVVMLVRFDHYGGRVGAVVASSEAGEYTCPMHPEIRQAGPGRCPSCGMTLVRRP